MRGPLAAALALAAGPAWADCAEDVVTVQGGFGEASFAVRVADDPAERAQGLMHVEAMAPFEGMLFVYEEPQPQVAFWMENTLIPLDMLFADATGTVVRIHEMAVPLDRTPIPGGEGVQFVLEINGGMAERLGLSVGDTLRHPAIGPDAADPCP